MEEAGGRSLEKRLRWRSRCVVKFLLRLVALQIMEVYFFISPPIDNSGLSKKKEKIVISLKDGYDYLNCSRKELVGRIFWYTCRPNDIPREILGHECSLSELSLKG